MKDYRNIIKPFFKLNLNKCVDLKKNLFNVIVILQKIIINGHGKVK